MKTRRSLILICSFILLSATIAMADSRSRHAVASRGMSRAVARPAGRVWTGTARSWNGASVSRSYLNRSAVRWNGQQIRRTGFVNGQHYAHWNGSSHPNWNGHWNHHHGHGTRFVFGGGFGYPWYYPYPYYSSYYDSYYPYGAYPAVYTDYSDTGYGQPAYGQPVYEGNSSYEGGQSDAKDANGSVVTEVQRLLTREGFYQGPIDGALGSRTYYAIRAYQRRHNVRADGQISSELLNTMGLR